MFTEENDIINKKRILFENIILWHIELKTFNAYDKHSKKEEIQKKFDIPSDIKAKDWNKFAKSLQNNTMQQLKEYYTTLHSDNNNLMEPIFEDYFKMDYKNSNLFEILQRESAEMQKNKTIQSNITDLLISNKIINSKNDIDITPANSGKSGCQIFTFNNKIYYIKPFSYSSYNNPSNSNFSLCNPKEAFLYKILEKVNFGPKTSFLIANGSSIENSVQKGNYIMTEGLDGLFIDNLNNKNVFDKIINSTKKEDLIQLSCASLLKGLLSLGDVFPDNNQNYGITKEGKFMFVDHLPSNNGDFVDMGEELNIKRNEEYSPRINLSKICNKDKYKNVLLGNLSSIAEKSYINFANKALAKNVNYKIFEECKIEEMIIETEQEVINLINTNQSCFTENAIEETQQLVKKIQTNIFFYKQTNYAKQGNSFLQK